MADVNISMDASSVIIATESVTKSMAAMTAGITAAKLETARYGSAGELLSATLKGLDADGRKFTATVVDMGGKLGVVRLKLDEIGKSADTAKNRLNDIQKAVNEVSGMFQRFVGFKALNEMTEALKTGFEAAKDFQVQISLIRTISQESQLSFGTWAKNLKDVSDQTGIGIKDVSKAAYDAISNQVAKGNEVVPFLKDAANLARVTGGSIADAGNLMASAMNSYGLSVADTTRLNALFFYTIDEGRVKMSDMANTFGRVGILGKGLGVSMEDLAGSIAFLTQKGVTTDDAFTFLKNVFIQFEKPSEALSAFFRRIGVDSGKAAIATFGYLGIIQKLKQEVSSGNTDVAKLFPEIRANQPIQAALNDTAGFERILNKAGDTAERIKAYQNAIDIRGESPADYINKEFNKLQNTFTVDIGQKLINLAKEILQGFSMLSEGLTGDKSLSAGLNLAIISIRDITIAIIAFRTGTAAATAVIGAYSAVMTAAGVATGKTAAQVTAANIAMRATIVGLAFAATALIATKLTFSNDLIGSTDRFESLTEAIKKTREETIRLNAIKSEPSGPTFNQRSGGDFQLALQGLAKFSIDTDKNLAQARLNVQRTTQEFENAFKTYSDYLKKTANELSERITGTENIIRNSQKTIQNFRDDLNKSIDAQTLSNLTPVNKIQFLSDQINVLEQRAKAAYEKGRTTADPKEAADAIAEGDKLYKELTQAYIERNKARDETRREAGRQFEQQNPNEPKTDDVAYKNAALGDIEQLKKELAQVYQQRVAAENAIIVAKKEQIRLDKEALAVAKERERNLEDKFKAYNTFNPFEADGGIKSQFKDASGKLDVNKARQELNRISDELTAAINTTGGSSPQDIAAKLQVVNTIGERRKQLEAEIKAAEQKNIVDNAKFKLDAAKKSQEEELAKNKDTFDKAAADQKATIEAAGQPKADFGKEIGNALNYRKSFTLGAFGYSTDVANLGDDPSGEKYAKTKFLVKQAEEAWINYQRTLEKVKTQQDVVNNQLVPKSENVAAFIQASQDFRNNYNALIKDVAGSGFKSTLIPGSNNTKTYGEVDTELQKIEDRLITGQGKITSAKAGRQVIEQGYDRDVKPVLEDLKSVNPNVFQQITEANTKATSSTYQTASAMDALREAIFNLKSGLTNFQVPAPVTGAGKGLDSNYPTAPSADIPQGILPGYEKPHAYGGWIGSGPRSTIGQDHKLVPAQDGEFMVNSESASMFQDTLTSINKARRGANVANVLGGNVSTSVVGDITVIVNESKDGQETGRQVWNKLRREMRRGNIS